MQLQRQMFDDTTMVGDGEADECDNCLLDVVGQLHDDDD